MDEFKSNSDASRSSSSLNQSPERKVEKVAEGKLVKKKNGLKELTDGFIQEDIGVVRTYLWRDVLLPAFKKTLWELITGSADMFLYGGSGAPKAGSRDKASWRDHYSVAGSSKTSSDGSRTRHSCTDVLFKTRAEAEAAYESLSAAIEKYGSVSIAELYSAAGITGEYTDNNYGWTDLRGATIARFDEGYLLKMPKPVVL